jgi:hypothetical protein
MFERLGITRNVRLRVPQFVAVGHILDSTDFIAVAPEAHARSAFEFTNLASAVPGGVARDHAQYAVARAESP